MGDLIQQPILEKALRYGHGSGTSLTIPTFLGCHHSPLKFIGPHEVFPVQSWVIRVWGPNLHVTLHCLETEVQSRQHFEKPAFLTWKKYVGSSCSSALESGYSWMFEMFESSILTSCLELWMLLSIVSKSWQNSWALHRSNKQQKTDQVQIKNLRAKCKYAHPIIKNQHVLLCLPHHQNCFESF